MNKFHAKKAECRQGHKHDSGKEAQFCAELRLRQIAGEIESYEVQKKFTLQPGFQMRPIDQSHVHPWKRRGEAVRAITYTADFAVKHPDGTTEFIDVKSKATVTEAFRIKWRLLQFIYKESPSVILTIAN